MAWYVFILDLSGDCFETHIWRPCFFCLHFISGCFHEMLPRMPEGLGAGPLVVFWDDDTWRLLLITFDVGIPINWPSYPCDKNTLPLKPFFLVDSRSFTLITKFGFSQSHTSRHFFLVYDHPANPQFKISSHFSWYQWYFRLLAVFDYCRHTVWTKH